jgi:type II secretory pathway component PulF
LRKQAGPYLSYYLVTILGKLKRGRTPGRALCDSGLFSKDTAVLLEIYSDTNSFEKGLHELATEGMDLQTKRISATAKVAGMLVLVIVFLFISWTYLSIVGFSSAIHIGA